MKKIEFFLKSLLKKEVSRKQFLKIGVSFLAFLGLDNPLLKIYDAKAAPDMSSGRVKKDIKTAYDLVTAKSDDPYKATIKAVKTIGGMERFVKSGNTVLIKPNIAWDKTPEQAANTNPDVVAALIDLCFEAGAKRVNVFDGSCNDAKRCYANSGVQQKAKEHGANVFFPSSWNTVKAKFSYKSLMQDWPIYREALECDTFINVPILKHHGLTGLTLSMKNLMGICSGNRGQMHYQIGKKLVDLTDFIKPELTVIDAYRVLLRHGPQGGDLADVEKKNTVIVSTDATLADTFAATFMNKDPLEIPYIKEAIARGFGNHIIKKANILHVQA